MRLRLRPMLWTEPKNGSGVNTIRLWAAGVIGVMLVVAGCAGATDGAPSTAPSTTASVVATPVANGAWDPCTIPDAAVQAAGLDVETKSANLVGELPISDEWATCFWRNPIPESWYSVGIFSSTHSLDYLREGGPFEQFLPIDGFDGLRFQRTNVYDEVSCGIAFGYEGGVSYLILDGLPRTEPLADPCVEVERLARSLRPSLPSSK